MIEVTIPIKTVGGLNAREHWRVRSNRVKNERYATRFELCSQDVPHLPCIVTMTRLSPGTLDSDNLQGAAKAIRDQVADFLGVNDNDPRVSWKYAQEKCPRGKFGVRVRIETTA
ncbi:MAG: hypothetical protein ACREPX_01695 [Rhodanobacteraceae bacterium]